LTGLGPTRTGYEPEAQYRLGVLYSKGTKDVSRNKKMSLKWLSKAAEQGHAKAQVELGHRYDEGIGIKKNDVFAVEWYRKSAMQGNMKGQTLLGTMLAIGEGIQKDIPKSFLIPSPLQK
jgi:TPR repeat protein